MAKGGDAADGLDARGHRGGWRHGSGRGGWRRLGGIDRNRISGGGGGRYRGGGGGWGGGWGTGRVAPLGGHRSEQNQWRVRADVPGRARSLARSLAYG